MATIGWNCYITQFDSLDERSDDEIWIRLAEQPWLEVSTEWRQRRSWRRLLWQGVPDAWSSNRESPATDGREPDGRHHKAIGAGRTQCPPALYEWNINSVTELNWIDSSAFLFSLCGFSAVCCYAVRYMYMCRRCWSSWYTLQSATSRACWSVSSAMPLTSSHSVHSIKLDRCQLSTAPRPVMTSLRVILPLAPC